MQDIQQLKAKVTSALDDLPSEGVQLLAEFAVFLQTKFNSELPQPQNDLEKDPLVGLFVGPPDLATRSEEILQQGITEKAGWTWKEAS